MKLNLKMSQLSTEDDEPFSSECADSVKYLHLSWECASESELCGLNPDIVLGADVIYDPLCLPHPVRVLSILLDRTKSSSSSPRECCNSAICGSHDYSDGRENHDVGAACNSAGNGSAAEYPMAYISSVIRNANTFHLFLALVDEANLAITNLTGALQPASLLPYLQSYDCSRSQANEAHSLYLTMVQRVYAPFSSRRTHVITDCTMC